MIVTLNKRCDVPCRAVPCRAPPKRARHQSDVKYFHKNVIILIMRSLMCRTCRWDSSVLIENREYDVTVLALLFCMTTTKGPK